jgi:hypothetical protein
VRTFHKLDGRGGFRFGAVIAMVSGAQTGTSAWYAMDSGTAGWTGRCVVKNVERNFIPLLIWHLFGLGAGHKQSMDMACSFDLERVWSE